MDTAMAVPIRDHAETAPVQTHPIPAGASRYFGAAAYHDRQFRNQVLTFAREAWFRARAPEFGIDTSFVIAHCHRAERRERLRDIVMLAVFLVFASRPLLVWLEYPDAGAEVLAWFSGRLECGLIAASAVLFIERLMTEHYTPTRTFDRARAAAFPEAPSAERQNVVVYGGYAPFVGSGYNVGAWSFSVNLERTRDQVGLPAEAQPFTTRELLGFVESRLDRLRIGGLSHTTMLFADGKLIRDAAAQAAFQGRPPPHLPQEQLERVGDSQAAGIRSYLCINVIDWSGEIVLSIYLRCMRGESNLFIEASYFLLAPPKRSFFTIDEADPRLRVGTVLRLIGKSLATGWLFLALTPLHLWAWLWSPLARVLARGRIIRAMQRNPRFNLGATTTIRELGMENYYRVYFQQLDKERHVKTIEQCAIDAIVLFLDERNIDSSDIRDRRSTILNNGVIVSGGDLNADNLAVGSGAKALLSRFGGLAGGRTASGSTGAHPAKATAGAER